MTNFVFSNRVCVIISVGCNSPDFVVRETVHSCMYSGIVACTLTHPCEFYSGEVGGGLVWNETDNWQAWQRTFLFLRREKIVASCP